MEYYKVMEHLTFSLNTKGQNKLFIDSLYNLKGMGFNISTFFLRRLVNGTNRQKTKRVSYLLSKNKLKTKRLNKDKVFIEKYKTSVPIVEYGIKNGRVCELNNREVEVLREKKVYSFNVLFMIQL
jgi:carbamoylphosphate synthase small subunit